MQRASVRSSRRALRILDHIDMEDEEPSHFKPSSELCFVRSAPLAWSRQVSILFGLLALLLLATPKHADAFAYLYSGGYRSPDVVMHSMNYFGTGGVIDITVGIDPTSVFATEMEISTQNVIQTWNALEATTGNLLKGSANNVPSGMYDFESVLLHEMGHALGLSHPNAGSESGLGGNSKDFTKADKGANDQYDLDVGPDNVTGSRDDLRGDDVNLNWFKKSDNNPFGLPASGIIDSTTYGRSVADLPSGDTFSANPDRAVAALEGLINTEAVLQQGIVTDEAQRTLAADDVAGIRYAMSGLNEIQGDADDYTINLIYAGLDASANIVLDFDDNRTSFAASSVGLFNLQDDHMMAWEPSVYFGSGVNWFFNDELSLPELNVTGDADLDGDVDLDDLILATSNFTGPGDFDKTQAQGDVEPFPGGDGDVDLDDIIQMVGNFTGPLDDEGGSVAAGAGDPTAPDLIYNPLTGEVILDASEANGSVITAYTLKAAGGLLSDNFDPFLGALVTSLSTQLAEGPNLSGVSGAHSIGEVFPIGMDLAQLTAFLTDRTVTGTFGSGTTSFDLVVVNAVPEPSSMALAFLGLIAICLGARRRLRLS